MANQTKTKEPDASGEPEKDKEPNAKWRTRKTKEPDASGEPKTKEQKETKTSEGPIEGKDQKPKNQNPDKAGKTTSESS